MHRKENKPPSNPGSANSSYAQYKLECNTDIRERASPRKKPRLLFKRPLSPSKSVISTDHERCNHGKAISTSFSSNRPMAPNFSVSNKSRRSQYPPSPFLVPENTINEEEEDKKNLQDPFPPSKGTGRSRSVITSLGDYEDSDFQSPNDGLEPKKTEKVKPKVNIDPYPPSKGTGRSQSVITSIGDRQTEPIDLKKNQPSTSNSDQVKPFYNYGQGRNYLDDRVSRNRDIRETQGREVPYKYPSAREQSRYCPQLHQPKPPKPPTIERPKGNLIILLIL